MKSIGWWLFGAWLTVMALGLVTALVTISSRWWLTVLQ